MSNTEYTEPPPIRTVDAMKSAAANWEGAMMVSTASDDPDECHRANVALIREERRMDEARHLFEFDEEGNIIGLANVKEHATLSAGASVNHGVGVETTEEHVNRAADRGC